MGKERQKIRELNEENRKIYLQTKLFLRRDVKDRKERKSVLDEFFGLLKEAQDKDLSPEEFFPEGYEVFYRDLLAGADGPFRRGKAKAYPSDAGGFDMPFNSMFRLPFHALFVRARVYRDLDGRYSLYRHGF